ncbi:MAG TPA: outer membrane protein transport protein [Vicinamibacterales bacterium]|nr:outer membrane protein transport protein [Vicinamibacterales bacterium]
MARHQWSGCVTALCLVLAVSERAAGQGYGVYEQGACAMARGGASVAAPCDDGSAIFFNPAAIAMQRDGSNLSAGATLIGPRGDFVGFAGGITGTMTENWVPVPAAYFTSPVGDRLSLGFGVFVPFGLTTEWPLQFAGRFVSYKTVLNEPYLQPTIAYKVNDHVFIGGGPDFVISRLELNQRADLATQQLAPGVTFAQLGVPLGTDFANFKINGSDFGIAGHVGVLVKANDTLSFGGRYLSRHTIKRDDLTFESSQVPTGLRTPVPLPGIPAGTPIDTLLAPQFAGAGRLASQSAATELTVPDQFVAGVAIMPTRPLKLLVDYQFTTWSVFDRLEFTTERGLSEVIVKNYRDTSGVRVGLDYSLSDRVALRGGFVSHQAAAPDGSVTPDLPEGARLEYTAGVGARFNTRFGIDLAYQYIDQEDRNGRVLLTGPDTGTYTFHANLFGASLVVHF